MEIIGHVPSIIFYLKKNLSAGYGVLDLTVIGV